MTRSGEHSRDPEATTTVHIRALLQIHLKSSAELAGLAPAQITGWMRRHDELVKSLLAETSGFEIGRPESVEQLDQGFLLLFERPAEAVLYALAYHRELLLLGAEETISVAAGVGIHLGEITLAETYPGGISQGTEGSNIAGFAKLVTRHVARLADVGQTLMTRMAYELAQRAMVGIESPEYLLEWVPRGSYGLAGLDEPYEIFEVGAQGVTVAEPPRDTETARRIAQRGESATASNGGWLSRRMVLTTAATTVAGGGLWWLLQSMGLIATAPLRDGQSGLAIAVLGFKNLSGRPETQSLGSRLAELLATELGAVDGLSVIPDERVVQMKTELSLPVAETLAEDTLREVRQNIGTDYVLVGSYLVLGAAGQLRLSFHLQPTTGGETISINAIGRESELVELVARATRKACDELGLERPQKPLGSILLLDEGQPDE